MTKDELAPIDTSKYKITETGQVLKMTKEENENEMIKDEMKDKISFALKDPILQQGFEIICENLAELEKEYIIRSLKKDIYDSLSPMDKQVIQYILTNKSINTLIDIQNFYNRFNPKKNLTYINDELLLPLLEKEIILKTGYTNKKIYDNNFNYRFILNKDKFNFDKDKIKRLNINKVIEVVR